MTILPQLFLPHPSPLQVVSYAFMCWIISALPHLTLNGLMRAPLSQYVAHRFILIGFNYISSSREETCCTCLCLKDKVILQPLKSQLVQQDSDLSNLAEYVTFARIRYVGCEVLSHNAVPVRWVLLVEEPFDELCNLFLCVLLVHDVVDLLFKVSLHFFAHLADDPLYSSLRSHFVGVILLFKQLIPNYRLI